MTTLNFPSNPSPGDTHTIGSTTWVWNGTAWIKAVSQTNTVVNTITATNVVVTTSTNSTSTTTGALVVNGGIGVAGDIYVGGAVYSGGSIALTTANLSVAFESGDDIDISVNTSTGFVRISNISTLQTVTDRGSTTTNVIHFANTSSSTSTFSGAVVIDGGVGIGGDTWIEGRVTSESLAIADSIFDSTQMMINTQVATPIDTYSLKQYRSSKYLIQIDEGTTATARCQVIELLVLATNTGTAHVLEYGSVMSDGDLGDFDVSVTNVLGDVVVTLYFMAHDTVEKTIKVLRTAMTV